MASASSVPVDRNAALAPARGPAIAIMVVSALGMVLALLSVALHLMGVSLGALQGRREGALSVMAGSFGVLVAGAGIVFYLVALVGALRMYRGKSYAMAWIATAIVALPCSYPSCCCLGFPVAIWSAIALMNDSVKSAFE